jgi:hypothetical protein
MYITISQNGTVIYDEGFHLGEVEKAVDFKDLAVEYPTHDYDYMIQADGHELEYIRHHWPAFVGKQKVQRFFGDFVRQILSTI